MDTGSPRVAFQGARGAFSEEAGQKVFGPAMTAVPCREFRDVGAALADGLAEYAVLPVENSIAGSVLPAYDVLAATAARVLAEVTLPIRLCVLGLAGADLRGLRRVQSHPVALAQCGKFFQAHAHLEAVVTYDTAGAAREVAALGQPDVAAIGPCAAGALYGLHVLAEGVQDRDDNQTRFYILGPSTGALELPASSRSKTALLLETADQPGALLSVLEPFARAGVNLTKLESRPGETPWTYRFFLELAGGLEEEPVAAAVRDVGDIARSVHVLGSFAVLSE